MATPEVKRPRVCALLTLIVLACVASLGRPPSADAAHLNPAVVDTQDPNGTCI